MEPIAFRQQCERLLDIIDDSVILENYVKMFCEADRSDIITPDGLNALLRTSFQLAMGHYKNGSPTYCLCVSYRLHTLSERYVLKIFNKLRAYKTF